MPREIRGLSCSGIQAVTVGVLEFTKRTIGSPTHAEGEVQFRGLMLRR